jgi:AcrR family transcriptional regulator
MDDVAPIGSSVRGKRGGSILEAARREFLASGFRRTSVSSIARAAGVAKGTVYLYWQSKEAIFRAVVQAIIEAMLRDARSSAKGPGPLEARLTGALQAKFVLVHQLTTRSPHGKDLLDESNGLSADLRPEGGATEAAWLLFHACEGLGADGSASRETVERRIARLVSGLVTSWQDAASPHCAAPRAPPRRD